jgi:uncharacterized protein involved in type VI secretion and phage assembly
MNGRNQGVAIGVVSNIDDPEGLGRIKVEYKLLGGQAESNWARIAMPFAGIDHGLFYPPEVEDEALVAFQHGNPDQPYIIGFLSSKHAPPITDDLKQRTIQSVAGHTIILDDNSDASLTIEDANGNKVFMSSEGILLEDLNGNIVEMSASGIKIESAAVITIKGSLIELNP